MLNHKEILAFGMVLLYSKPEEFLAELLLNDAASFLYIVGKTLLEVWLVYLLCYTAEKLLLELEEAEI